LSVIHLGQAFTRQGHGEMLVRFHTLCEQTLRNPANVTGDIDRATCRTCLKEIRAAITDETLKALIRGQIPNVNAYQAFKVEDEWALYRKGSRDAACVSTMW